ncbi:hypothetical protein P4O66_002544 [Electrophorus voltai]|uniref:Cadherin domain-containing protein n=1 Tax=Electrophorus voltai TaxID=2609070 RepID=A0AAD8YZB1_9TELE|nr:hypothetical protein P4O66_002544 [Electrophorus voltai]
MRLDVASNRKYLDVNKDTGEMYIVERIDREYLCLSKSATTCVLKLDATIENPVRLFNIELEIMDINDNAPHFRRDSMHLDISEATTVGERFSLTNAVDPDIGSNSVKTYYLSESDHFNIEIQTGRDGSKFADLILKKALDREQQDIHSLILTAVDGGVPARSGTASIIVRVLDTNDNAPQFDTDSYTINLTENSPIGSLVVKLNASDKDDGSNAEIIYSFSLYTSEKTQDTFSLNQANGEIRVKEMVNFEDFKIYNMEIIATDRGKNSLSGQCKLTILITDMNDNHPEISVKSFTNPIKEDIAVGTVIAVVSVTDKDSGENGQMDIYISDGLPFLLRESSDNYYELVITAPLDREKVPEYDITFTVRDRGNPPLSDNETVTLELLDVNDNVPQFPQTFYTIPVMENNAPGALLYSLTAIDPDLHENQYLVYFIIEKEIVNTSISILFSINPENGNLYALKTFDYEIEKEFLFHIEARDSGVPPLSSTVTVHIIIMDQNDNTPVIVSPWRAHGSVVEEKIPRSTDKGTLIAKVIAIDTDSVHNSRITYQFLQNTDATLFSLDQYNGEIRTMRMFSYRDSRHQRLVVIAKDNGEPSLSATVTIKLSTVETALKTYADMTEVPLEYDIFSDLNLYLVIGLGSVSFLLLITILVTIVLKCQKPKPSKAAPPCRNSVISERNSTIADSTLVSNDAYWYSLFLAETRKGKLVVRQPVPKGARYIVSSIPRSTGLTETSDSAASTLQLDFDAVQFVNVHKNGNLYALKTFDYEIEKEFLFHIEARDSGVPPLSSTVTVHIIIMDQNDNTPVIVSPWRAHGSVVEEKIPRSTDKGTLIAKVIAIDTDSVHNSRITYQFLQNTDATLFSLDQYNGEIRTMRMFSYRDSRHQRLVVIAKDNGEPSLSATVTIKLSTVETALKTYADMTEVPLEYDIFSDLNLYLVIGLGSVSFLLLITILVTIVLKCQKPKPSKAAPPCRNSVISERNSTIADSTLVSNDAYWYSLFLAETRKGKLVVRQPVPKGARYIVSSIPRSTGLTETSDSAASTLQVSSDNYYELVVTESLDREKIPEYDITFTVTDRENGNLYALKAFDYEIEKEFLFHIEARDSGVPPLSSNVTVHIVIMDQNDNTPVIVSPWRAHGSVVEEKIPRSTDKGTLIAKVIAIDTDSVHNSRITYQFLQNTDATLFSLDQYNGEIRTMRMFSYRDSRHQRLVVVAKDNGDPSLSATVTIKLSTVETALKTYADMTEVPLEYDIFSDLNLYLVIGLGSVSFLLLITILVTIVLKCQKPKPSKAAPPCRNSVISERNSTIADSTLVSNDAYWYSLFLAETRKGKLVVRQPVPKGARYIVSSIPRSTGLTETSDSAASTLQIRYSLQEESKIGTVVGNLAKDLGIHTSALAVRNLRIVTGTKQELFQITVDIVDVNDNAPTFIDETYNLEILESAVTGTRYQLEETDDSGDEGKIPFLVLQRALDRERSAKHNLVLTAVDGGKPQKTGTLSITVVVSDVNDNAPVCSQPKYTATVREDAPDGAFLLHVNATDADEGPNGEIEYSLRNKFRNGASDLFELDSKTGELWIKGALDFEEKQVYEIKIVASDKGAVSLSTQCNVLVKVEDVNDNPPEIDVTSLTGRIPEDAPPAKDLGTPPLSSTKILRVEVIDINDNSPMFTQSPYTFYIEKSVVSFLNINEVNGTVTALRSFDFESMKTFQFHVLATDSGTPPLSSNVTVNVYILDQNDNVPVILYPVSANGSDEGVEEIPRNVNAGHLVTKVRAYDADIGYNGWLLFSMQEVSDHTLFGLDRYTGQIRTLRSFTETDEAQHKLVILVKDNGNVSLSATATVIIKVVEPKEAFAASDVKSTVKEEEENNVTFYLIITLGSVSMLFVISIIVLIVMQCSKSTDYSSKYLQDTNYDGTLCHSIQYRSGDKRYMLVGPRMSIGSTIVPGSNGNTLVVQDRRRRTSGEVRKIIS